MFQTSWVAVVRGRDIVLGKLVRRGYHLKILQLSEIHLEGDSENQAMQLKAWLKKLKVPTKQLRLALSCPGVITRMISLPFLTRKDLNKLLTEQVDQYFTLNIADYLVDYRVLDHYEENGRKMQRILLAALPKVQWETVWSVWQKARIKPKIVDLAADSLGRLYSFLLLRKKSKTEMLSSVLLTETKNTFADDLDIAIVDLQPGRVEIVLLEQGKFFLYSDLSLNLEDGQGAQEKDALPSLRPGQLTDEDQREGQDRVELESTLNPLLRTLAEFIHFFSARHFGKSVDRIYLTGKYAYIPRLTEIFEENLEVETVIGFPRDWRPLFAKKTMEKQAAWMKYGSLYGMALRED